MGGLYKNVTMSLKTADRLIALGLIALIAVTFFAVKNGGFTVTFDTLGGTVAEQKEYKYGETIEVSAPTKEGFIFSGWFLDPECTVEWNSQDGTVKENMTLYAKWQEKSRN